MSEIVWREAIVTRETQDVPAVQADTLHGYAIVFNQRSKLINENGSQFFEAIAPGAFTDSIKRNNVTFTFQHFDAAEYGDTKSGTLKLSEDQRGHPFVLTLPAYANTMRAKIESGAIRGMSFGFIPQEVEVQPDGLRVVKKGDLRHISPVYSPAYPMTTVTVSSGVRAKRENDLREKFLRFIA